MFFELDANKDGFISEEEFLTIGASFREGESVLPMGSMMLEPHTELFMQFGLLMSQIPRRTKVDRPLR